MQSQQKFRPKSPYIAKPKRRPGDKPILHPRLPPSYTSHTQESYQSNDSAKTLSPSKSRIKPSPDNKSINFYYFNVNSYFPHNESPKNLTIEPKSNEYKDKGIKGNVLYTSYEMVPAARVLSRHNSIKAQQIATNTSGQSLKANTSSQVADQQSNFSQYISTVSKKVSNSILLHQHLNRNHSHLSPSSPNLPKSIKKQLIGTLSCMRPQSTSVNMENKGFMCYPKAPSEDLKSSNAFYENMKSYIRGHMEHQNPQNYQTSSSYVRTTIENSKEVQTASQVGGGGSGLNVKTNSFYKPFRPLQQVQVKKDDGGDQSWNEQQNLKMRQALLRNLVEISSAQAVKGKEKKSAESMMMDNATGYFQQRRPESQGKVIKKRIVSPHTMSGDGSSLMTAEIDGGQNTILTNVSTTQETPRGLSRKKMILKNLTMPKKPEDGAGLRGNKRYSASINRLANKTDVPKQEYDSRSYSRHSFKRTVKNDSKSKTLKVAEKMPSGPFLLLQDGWALEKELAIQQGRTDAVEGWDKQFDSVGSPMAIDKVEIKNFSSLV